MRVPVRDDVAARESAPQALVPSMTRPRVVNEADPEAFSLDDAARRQLAPESRVVHVPVNRLHGAELSQLGEHRGGREVAHVDDEIGGVEQAQARVGKPARAARQVRVADQRDQERPSRKRPSR